MDFLFWLAAAALAGLGYRLHRERGVSAALRHRLHSRDEEIRHLRRQLAAAEAAQLAGRARFAALANLASDAVFLLDAEHRVLLCNTAAAGLFSQSSPIGKKLDEVMDSVDLINLVQYAVGEEGMLEEQLVIGEADYRAQAQMMRGSDGRAVIGVVMQDITQLVSLNRSRRDLVANISHELRTPITRIRLIIESLFLDHDRPKRKASIQSLKEISMEADALLWLAQELLDLSMIESGQTIMKLVETPLQQIADEAIERIGGQAEMKELVIVSHIPKKYAVLCDADQLRRVFANLLHNAIKWSPKKETISITAAEREDEIIVAVFDRGPGVPDDLRERIFERFYQADVSRSGDEGTGLGLAICKHIIEAHGGRIWAEGNGHGKGGHFLFTVLKADASVSDDDAAALNSASAQLLSDSLGAFQ